ncbi:(2,3-dihydroxybenzoyl)adenylate synthase [Larsenimonas salina]|uniref:(2,3-dihydroxybenzoyl)adenylate synthase n=1 Tax=Larsenimonas salina TaxID=1295565 RepID=UPI002074A49C|nr:AMP-binding protein [Larsenimonas salina]MCM5704297.1 AMP-binding protein [Larsenimonas salina]
MSTNDYIAADLDEVRAKSPDYPEAFKQHYRDQGLWSDQTFGELLKTQAERFAADPALVDGETRLSYRALDARVDRLCAGLQRSGLKKGDRVVVQLGNRASFVVTTFALFRLGLLPVFALPAHRAKEITHFCTASNARALITMADRVSGQPRFDFRTLAHEVQAACPTLEHVYIDGAPEEFTALESLESDAPLLEDWPGVDADDLAFFQLSGGTTGLSKLIPRRHQDYLYSVIGSLAPCGFDERTTYLIALPGAHNFPMSSPGFLGVIAAGGCMVMAPEPSPTTCFELIEREGVTHTALVPPLAMLWLDAAAHTERDLSSLQVLQVGGSKMNSEAAKRVGPVLGCTLQQVFGMAEGLVNYTRLDDDEDVILYTQGRPISALDEVRIVDDHGQPVAPGTPGNLQTRGPYTIRGYFDNSGINAKSFTADGFYCTGDVVAQTPAGYLIVGGREKDQINRGGEKISPEEVENLILAHPDVFDTAVVAMPDDFLGERPCAFVIPRKGVTAPDTPTLVDFLKTRGLATFKLPDQVRAIDAFPHTGVGKISKKALRQALKDTYFSA